jgi:hypothetical protein
MGKQARALPSRLGGGQMILAPRRRPSGRTLCALADRWSCGQRVAYRGGADSSVQIRRGVETRCQKAIFFWRDEAPVVYGLWSSVRQAVCRGGNAMIWLDAVTARQPSEISALAAAVLLGPEVAAVALVVKGIAIGQANTVYASSPPQRSVRGTGRLLSIRWRRRHPGS